jgi:hypothetical protein
VGNWKPSCPHARPLVPALNGSFGCRLRAGTALGRSRNCRSCGSRSRCLPRLRRCCRVRGAGDLPFINSLVARDRQRARLSRFRCRRRLGWRGRLLIGGVLAAHVALFTVGRVSRTTRHRDGACDVPRISRSVCAALGRERAALRTGWPLAGSPRRRNGGLGFLGATRAALFGRNNVRLCCGVINDHRCCRRTSTSLGRPALHPAVARSGNSRCWFRTTLALTFRRGRGCPSSGCHT